MPYQVNSTYAKSLRDFAYAHPEMEKLTFADTDVVEKYVAVIGSDDAINESLELFDDGLFIDPSYNNIYEDYLNTSYVPEADKAYFKFFVDKNNSTEIIDIINKAIINPLLSMKNIDSPIVYIRIHDATNAYLFNEVIRL